MTLCFDQRRKWEPFKPKAANSALTTKKEGNTTTALLYVEDLTHATRVVPVVPALLILQGGCYGAAGGTNAHAAVCGNVTHHK